MPSLTFGNGWQIVDIQEVAEFKKWQKTGSNGHVMISPHVGFAEGRPWK
jgi:hypothetical protein